MTAFHALSETESKGPAQLAVCVTFLLLTWLSVGMRCWVRIQIIHGFGWDDALMVVALIFFTVYASALIVLVLVYGGGSHLSVVKSAMHWILADEVFYVITAWMTKLSLGVFFLRIIIRPWQRYMVYLTMVVSTLTSLFFFFFLIFMCGNPNDYLIRYVSGKCAPHEVQLALTYVHACINLVMDWMFAVLPIQIVLQANMEKRAKVMVACILSLGAVGSICSTIRLKYVSGLVSTTDFFWNAAMIAIWSCIECGAGITAGSLATVRPLVKHWTIPLRLPSSFTSSFRRKSRSMAQSQRPDVPTNSSQNASARPWTKLEYDSSLTTSDGGQEIQMADAPRSRSIGSQPEVADLEANRMTTIEERCDAEDNWPLPEPPSQLGKKSFDVDLELGWLYTPPREPMTRRSSNALGEEEARRVRGEISSSSLRQEESGDS